MAYYVFIWTLDWLYLGMDVHSLNLPLMSSFMST